jgi:hypothetical protein
MNLIVADLVGEASSVTMGLGRLRVRGGLGAPMDGSTT